MSAPREDSSDGRWGLLKLRACQVKKFRFLYVQGLLIKIILQISNTLTYTMDETHPIGDKVSGIEVNGVPLDPAASYRVSANNFLAGGGDGFPGFTAATDVTGGPIDVDAFTANLTANSPVAPPLGRINTVG